MENPETWDESDKAIVEIFKQFDADTRQGVIGLSLYRRLGDYVRAERQKALEKALEDLIALDKVSR